MHFNLLQSQSFDENKILGRQPICLNTRKSQQGFEKNYQIQLILFPCDITNSALPIIECLIVDTWEKKSCASHALNV